MLLRVVIGFGVEGDRSKWHYRRLPVDQTVQLKTCWGLLVRRACFTMERKTSFCYGGQMLLAAASKCQYF